MSQFLIMMKMILSNLFMVILVENRMVKQDGMGEKKSKEIQAVN